MRRGPVSIYVIARFEDLWSRGSGWSDIIGFYVGFGFGLRFGRIGPLGIAWFSLGPRAFG